MEHALCPLVRDSAARSGQLHTYQYLYTDKHRNRKQATAIVACPFGLSPNDEFYLFGLLSLTLSQPNPASDFYATPHWCLKQLGIVDADNQQQKRYDVFRGAIRRLAGVVYENDRFYDPVRGEHRDIAFGFLKYSLPIDPASSRAWHFVWDEQFFRFCQATAGSLRFDLELYRSLDYASRRLFLLLQKIFWRNDHSPAFEIRHLAVNTLGFSASLATKDIRQKLLRVARRLLQAQIVELPLGAETINDLFEKKGTGRYVIRFHRGAYFLNRRMSSAQPVDSPLAEPLETIGFDQPAIRRILRQYDASQIQTWTDITLAAVERGIIHDSPAAYFMYYIREAQAKRTTPPDWWNEIRRQEYASQRATTGESGLDEQFEEYLQSEAREAFDRISRRLFHKLCEAGQSETDAHDSAEYTARMHLRREFHQTHSLTDSGRLNRLSDILADRYHSETE